MNHKETHHNHHIIGGIPTTPSFPTTSTTTISPQQSINPIQSLYTKFYVTSKSNKTTLHRSPKLYSNLSSLQYINTTHSPNTSYSNPWSITSNKTKPFNENDTISDIQTSSSMNLKKVDISFYGKHVDDDYDNPYISDSAPIEGNEYVESVEFISFVDDEESDKNQRKSSYSYSRSTVIGDSENEDEEEWIYGDDGVDESTEIEINPNEIFGAIKTPKPTQKQKREKIEFKKQIEENKKLVQEIYKFEFAEFGQDFNDDINKTVADTTYCIY